jgi:hypothetical protein
VSRSRSKAHTKNAFTFLVKRHVFVHVSGLSRAAAGGHHSGNVPSLLCKHCRHTEFIARCGRVFN